MKQVLAVVLQIMTLIFGVLYYSGCSNVSHPYNPCGNNTDPYTCLNIVPYSVDPSECCGYKWALEANDPVNRPRMVTVVSDTLDGSTWVMDNTTIDLYRIINGKEALDCGSRKQLVNGDSVCRQYRRWRILKACWEGSPCKSLSLPKNDDIKIDCRVECSNCNEIKYSNLSKDQRLAVQTFYHDLLFSEKLQVTSSIDFISAFIPAGGTSQGTRSTNINNISLQSTGDPLHFGVSLPNPIPVKNTPESFDELTFTVPNVVSGNIIRKVGEVQVKFNTLSPEFITLYMTLKPSGVNRQDVIKNIYLIQSEQKLLISGDFVCLSISGIPGMEKRPYKRKYNKIKKR